MSALRILAAMLPVAWQAAAAEVNPELLNRAREQVRTYMAQLPDYVCRVNIERFERATGRGKFLLRDRLHLEVAFVNGKEMYGHPGESQFEDGSIERVTGGTGAMSTGSYAMHLREAFVSGRPDFTAAATVKQGGREHIRIGFAMPRERSVMVASDGREHSTIGYAGFVMLSPGSFDLEELHVEATDIPRKISLAGSAETTIYRRVRIGEREFSLPLSSDLLLTTRRGMELRNAVSFQNCRQYGAEATIRFEAPAETPAAAEAAPRLVLPAGTAVTLELTTELNEGLAIGDPVEARVVDGKGIPKGAVVRGHITRRGRQRDGRNYGWNLFGIRLERIETEGRTGTFQATLEAVAPNQAPQVRRNFRVADLASRMQPGEGAFVVGERELPVHAGLRMTWRTE